MNYNNNSEYMQNDGPFPSSSRRIDPLNNIPMYSQSPNNSKSSGRLNSLGGSNFHLPNLGKKKKNRNIVDDDDDYLGSRGPRGGMGGVDDDDEKDTNIAVSSDVKQMNFSDLSHMRDRGRYGGFDAMDTAPIIPVLDMPGSGLGSASSMGGMSSAQYRKQKTLQKKQMMTNISKVNNSYQHNHNLLNPIGADDYNEGSRSMSLAGNQPRSGVPVNNYQQPGPRSMSFTNNPMSQHQGEQYPPMQHQQGYQQGYSSDPRAMSLQNSSFQTRNQSMMNGQNPMMPNGRNQSMMNGQNPMMPNGRNQSLMNGQNPMMPNGRNQSMMNGQNPLMPNGRNQSMMNGQNPMMPNGRNQSMMNGQNPMMPNGRNQSMMNGQNPMMPNGRNQSLMNGQNPMMPNGRNQSMMNGQNPLMPNGRNQSMMNGQNPMMPNGRNQSMMNGQNPMMPNGRNQSMMNGQNPMMPNGRNQSMMNGQNPLMNNEYQGNNGNEITMYGNSSNTNKNRNIINDPIPPTPPPPPTKSELDRLKNTPKRNNANSPGRYESHSPNRYKTNNGSTTPSKYASSAKNSPVNYGTTTPSKFASNSPAKYNSNNLDRYAVKHNDKSANNYNNSGAISSSKANTPGKYDSLEFGNPYSVRDSEISNNDLFNDLVRDEEDTEYNHSDGEDKSNNANEFFNPKSNYYRNYNDNSDSVAIGKPLDFNKSHNEISKKSQSNISDDEDSDDNINFGSKPSFGKENQYSKNIHTNDTPLSQKTDNRFRFNDSDSENDEIQPPTSLNMRRKPPPIDPSDTSSSTSLLNRTQIKNENSKNNFMAKLEASIDDTSVVNSNKNGTFLSINSDSEYSNRMSRSNYKTLASPDEEQISKGFFNRRKSSSFGDDDLNSSNGNSSNNKRESKRVSSRGSITGGAGMNGFFKKLGLKKKNSISESSKKKKNIDLDDLNSSSYDYTHKKLEQSFDESLELADNNKNTINNSKFKAKEMELPIVSNSNNLNNNESTTDRYGYKFSNKHNSNLDDYEKDDNFNLTTKYGVDTPSHTDSNNQNIESNVENSRVDKYGYKLSNDAYKSREKLLSNDFNDSKTSLRFHSNIDDNDNHHNIDHINNNNKNIYIGSDEFTEKNASFGDYMNSVISDIGDKINGNISKEDEDDGLGFATAKAEVMKEVNSNNNNGVVRTNYVPLSKKINFSVEQLGILSANKSLMNELQLMTKELTDSVQREIKLESELRSIKLGKNDESINNSYENKFEDLQDEIRSKVLEQAKMVDELNRERKLRQLAEEHVIAWEVGKSNMIPSSLEMNYKITDLQTQLLEYQDKINQQEELITKHDTEMNILKEENLKLEIELQGFKNDTVPNLVNEIEILKKSDLKNYQKAQEQLSLYKQEIQNLKMKLIGNSKTDNGRIESNNEAENQRDALREALKNLRESKDKEIRHGKERIQQLERRVTKLSELNEKLQQKLLG